MANPPAGHSPSPTHKTVPQALRQLVERLGLSRRFAFPVATVVVAAVLAAVLVDGPTDDLADDLAEPAAHIDPQDRIALARPGAQVGLARRQ